MLKYILTSPEVCRSLTQLNIDKDSEDLDKKLVEDEIKRQKEFWDTLIEMPDFIDFMKKYGETAFKLIKVECFAYAQKYAKKIEEKPYYENLVNAIDVHGMQMRFDDLCKAINNTEQPDCHEAAVFLY
jgi:hypothetical protein